MYVCVYFNFDYRKSSSINIFKRKHKRSGSLGSSIGMPTNVMHDMHLAMGDGAWHSKPLE